MIGKNRSKYEKTEKKRFRIEIMFAFFVCQDLIQTNRDLQMKLIDLFVDYTDIDSGVEWAQYYNLTDFEIPEQVALRRREIVAGNAILQPITFKRLDELLENDIYKPVVVPTDIVYIEADSDVDEFLHRLEVKQFLEIDANIFLFLSSVHDVMLVHVYHLLVSIVKRSWIPLNEH